jgi:hypothetical protein
MGRRDRHEEEQGVDTSAEPEPSELPAAQPVAAEKKDRSISAGEAVRLMLTTLKRVPTGERGKVLSALGTLA